MEPQSPVVEGLEPYEIVIGADQEGVQPLPALRSPAPNYIVMSRWALTAEERALIAEGADVYLQVWTFGNGYPPTMLHVMRASADGDLVKDQLQLDEELDQRLRAVYARMSKERGEHEQSKTCTGEGFAI